MIFNNLFITLLFFSVFFSFSDIDYLHVRSPPTTNNPRNKIVNVSLTSAVHSQPLRSPPPQLLLRYSPSLGWRTENDCRWRSGYYISDSYEWRPWKRPRNTVNNNNNKTWISETTIMMIKSWMSETNHVSCNFFFFKYSNLSLIQTSITQNLHISNRFSVPSVRFPLFILYNSNSP